MGATGKGGTRSGDTHDDKPRAGGPGKRPCGMVYYVCGVVHMVYFMCRMVHNGFFYGLKTRDTDCVKFTHTGLILRAWESQERREKMHALHIQDASQ